MHIINLLPIEQKKNISREETRRLVQCIAALLSACFIIGSSLLFPSFLPLHFERVEWERTLAIGEEAAKVLRTNEISTRIHTLQSGLRSFSAFIEESGGIFPLLSTLVERKPGITLSTVVIRANGEVLLSGNAETRRSLLDFERSLRDGGLFQEIVSPLYNIIRERDIFFTMQGKLKSPRMR